MTFLRALNSGEHNHPLEKHDVFSRNAIAFFALMVLAVCIVPRALAPLPVAYAVITWMWQAIAYDKSVCIHKGALRWGAALLAIGAITIIWSVHPQETVSRLSKITVIVTGAVLLITIVSRFSESAIKKALWLIPLAFVLAVAFRGVDALLDFRIYQLIHDTRVVHMHRLKWHMTVLACLLFPAIGMMWHVLAKDKRVYVCGGVVALTIGVLLMGITESAYVGVLVGLLTMLLPLHKKWLWRVMRVAYVAIILTMPWTTQWAFTHLAEWVDNAPVLGSGYAHGAQRLEIYDAVSRYILESPILGYGLESTPNILDLDIQGHYQPYSHILHPHNSVLQLWLELGFAGVAFMAALGWCLLRAMEASPSAMFRRVSLASFMLMMFISVTTYGIWQSWWMGLHVMVLVMLLLLARSIHATATNQPQAAVN